MQSSTTGLSGPTTALFSARDIRAYVNDVMIAMQMLVAVNDATMANALDHGHQQPQPNAQQQHQPPNLTGPALQYQHPALPHGPNNILNGNNTNVSYRLETLAEAVLAVRELIDSEQAYQLEETITEDWAKSQARFFENRRKEDEAIAAKEERTRGQVPYTSDGGSGEDCTDKWEIAGTEYPHYEHFAEDVDTTPTYDNAFGLFFDPYERDDFDALNVSECPGFEPDQTMD